MAISSKKYIQDAIHKLTDKLLQAELDKDSDQFAVLHRWSELNKRTVLENCVSIIMMKIARIERDKSVDDSLLDIAGYAILALSEKESNEWI